MILEILREIGEGCFIGIVLLVFFTILTMLFSRKKMNLQALIPLIGGFFGFCIGVFLGGFISETGAIIGGILFSPIGLILSINLTREVSK